MILIPNIVSIEHSTFTYLSVYNPTAKGTLELKAERLNLLGSQFLERVHMV